MEENTQRRIDDIVNQVKNYETWHRDTWREHMTLHDRERSQIVNRQQFIVGLVVLSILQVGITVFSYVTQ